MHLQEEIPNSDSQRRRQSSVDLLETTTTDCDTSNPTDETSGVHDISTPGHSSDATTESQQNSENPSFATTPLSPTRQNSNTSKSTLDSETDLRTLNQHQAPNRAVEIVCQENHTPQNAEVTTEEGAGAGESDAPYSVWSGKTRSAIVILTSFAALVSPLSSAVYFPATTQLADDMHVSVSLINLTITSYLIFQGLAPAFTASFSDTAGRRPAYMVCGILYLAANIGLATQNNYAALFVLRCLQSAGSSGTVALVVAVVADVSTRAERGSMVAYATLGTILGPALGPVIGGLLNQYLGWRSIFWFLTIYGTVIFLAVGIFLPETCRAVVGNGSIPPPRWNMSAYAYVRLRIREHKTGKTDIPQEALQTREKVRRRPNPIAALKVAGDFETAIVLVYGAMLYAGYYIALSTLSEQLVVRYHLNSVDVGLCYLSIGCGSLTSRWTFGPVLDWNFKRYAKRIGMEIVKNRNQDITDFPIEHARLEIVLPLVYAACATIITYGWCMQYTVPLGGLLVVLFFCGSFISGGFGAQNTIIIDIHRASPATATAASNLFRCLLGAGAAGIAAPMIGAWGIGWACTFVGFVWIGTSPALWAVMYRGHGWRREKARNLEERKVKENAEKAAGL